MAFVQGLSIDRELTVPDSLSNPEVMSAFDAAQRRVLGDESNRPIALASVASLMPDALVLEPMPVAENGASVPFVVRVKAGLDFQQLMLYFHADGSGDYLASAFRPVGDGDRYQATVPAPVTRLPATEIAYFVEAKLTDGSVVARLGERNAPKVVLLGDAARLAALNARKSAVKAELKKSPDQEQRPKSAPGKYWLRLGGGVGYGRASGSTEVNQGIGDQSVTAMTGSFHVKPEFGFFINRHWAVAITARLSATPTANDLVNPECGSDGICEGAAVRWLASPACFGSPRPQARFDPSLVFMRGRRDSVLG